MYRKEQLVPNQYYHIYSRTISGMPVFKNRQTAGRFVQALSLSNSVNSTRAYNYLRNVKGASFEEAMEIAREGERLVDVLCFVIMSDHYHLLLKELKEDGISNFIRSCNTSIAKYVNIKQNRKGPLFESRFRSKNVNSDEYLLHLTLYIHLNPLDFIDGPDWRNHKLKNWEFKKQKLLDYPWSSLNSFLDKDLKNPVLSGKEIILEHFGGGENYEKYLREWSEENIGQLSDLFID